MKTNSKKIDATTMVTTAFLVALVGAAYYIRQHHETIDVADSSRTIVRTISAEHVEADRTRVPSTSAVISREH